MKNLIYRIPLTKGKFAIVDERDILWLMAMGSWHYNITGYARKRNIGNRLTYILMHRIVIEKCRGISDLQVDHINGDTLDNRLENLRYCTYSENQANRSRFKNKYKGISWINSRQKWQASIQYNNTRYFLGYFDNEIDAAKAYDKAALKYFKEFAKLNFPELQNA